MNCRAALSLACAAFLMVATAQAAAPQAGVPTWSVGDSWAMGAKDIDLTPIMNALVENMQQYFSGMTLVMTGKMGFYELFEVTRQDSQFYNLAANQGVEMTADVSFSGSYSGQQISATAHSVMTLNMNGTMYFTKEDMRLSKYDGTMDFDMTMSGGAGMLGNMNMNVNITGNISVTFTPALNLFDFPLSVGDNWAINSTAAITGTVSGKASVPMFGEVPINQNLDSTVPLSISASCPSTSNITLADGSSTTAYKIAYTGADFSGTNIFLPAGVLYYSPDKRFVVSQELSFTDAMGGLSKASTGTSSYTYGLSSAQSEQTLFTASPMSRDAATSAISGLGTGGSNILPLVIVAVVAIAIVASTAIVIKKRS
ncbi:MAG: hypothetical protein AB1305_00600 [Candidatus Hadarchaeota archaeon]